MVSERKIIFRAFSSSDEDVGMAGLDAKVTIEDNGIGTDDIEELRAGVVAMYEGLPDLTVLTDEEFKEACEKNEEYMQWVQ